MVVCWYGGAVVRDVMMLFVDNEHESMDLSMPSAATSLSLARFVLR